MCGIAGYVNFRGLDKRHSPLTKMCSALEHRGPDGYGYFSDEHVALGHRRLSIIDVAGGAQPIGNEDGSIQVTFNGEIYNFPELRGMLVSRGHQFRTHSDTEVLVHLYEDVGERLPEYLNGMFAFAIWDVPRRTLFLARDRFGEKPLYYFSDIAGFDFCFASEMKALAAIPGFRANIRPESVADYLCFHYVPDPHTIYDGVYRLEPGHSLTVSQLGIQDRTYWRLPLEDDAPRAIDQAVEQLKSLAADCVRRRLISDVPLGAFLSGGVDSSAVVAFMAQTCPDQFQTFCIGFTNPEFDELAYARLVAAQFGTKHHEKVLSPLVGEMLPTAVAHFDEPFGDASAIPTLYVSKLTREHVTVAMSGDGADEVFGGYRRYLHGVTESKIRRMMPDWFRTGVFRRGAESYPTLTFAPQVFRAKAVLRNISLEIADAYFNSVTGLRDEALQRVLSPALRRTLSTYSPREAWRKRFETVSHLSPLKQMQKVDFETYLPADILVKVDRATMAYSLESRAPWLDHRLAELAWSLPQAMHVNGNVGKILFKRALRELLPRQILTRPKMGFSVPLKDWFGTTLQKPFQELVFRPEMERHLDLGEVRRLWREQQSGVGQHEQNLWAVFMLANWDAVHLNAPAAQMVETAIG